MKFYLISIITIMTLAASTVTAQDLNFGVKAGLNSYDVQSDNSITYNSKLGMHAGLITHMHLDRQYAVQAELVYSMQGATSGPINLSLDYVNIPVLFQYMFENGLRIQAGPQLGVLLNAKVDNSNMDITVDVKNEYKPIDLGVSLGASYVHFPTGFGLDARYNLGLTDTSESSSISTTNTGFQIGVFYLFSNR